MVQALLWTYLTSAGTLLVEVNDDNYHQNAIFESRIY